jgi:hypothetical protein
MNFKLLKTILSLLLFAVLGTAGFAGEHLAPDVADFLLAIRQVESGDRYDCPPGPVGEQGPYQFKRDVWYQHTRENFRLARSRYADEVALMHYRWLKERLRKNDLEVSPWNLAAAWNAGVSAVVSQRIPRGTRDYANRVANLVRADAELRRRLTPVIKIASL